MPIRTQPDGECADQQQLTRQTADSLRTERGVETAIENAHPEGFTDHPKAAGGIEVLATGDAHVTEMGAPVRLVYESVFSNSPVEFDGYLAYVSTRRGWSHQQGDEHVTEYAVADRHPDEFTTREEFDTSDVVSWRLVDDGGVVRNLRDNGSKAEIGAHMRTQLAPRPDTVECPECGRSYAVGDPEHYATEEPCTRCQNALVPAGDHSGGA